MKRIPALTVLASLLCGSAALAAADHVASPADLRNELRSSAAVRQRNIEKLRNFLSTGVARTAMERAHVDADRIRDAVPLLTDQELARLTAQAERAQNDFAAGLTSFQVTLIIVAAILLAVIVAIEAA